MNGIWKKSQATLFLALLFGILPYTQAGGIITTIAGTGEYGYSGDGGLAIEAKLNDPIGVAVDNIGNVYIADTDNHLVRKIDTNGIIASVAGTGRSGYDGEGGLATNAQLSSPHDVILDKVGNLYIADANNHRVRMVDTSGYITTIAGNGDRGYSGDGGRATAAQLYSPNGIALDNAGNLYIADTSNHRVRKVTNGIITTIAGTGESGYNGDRGLAENARLSSPTSVAVDGAGNVYIADYNNHRIRMIDSTNNTIHTVVGTGDSGFSGNGVNATEARLYNPYDVLIT